MRSPGGIDHAVQEQKTSALLILSWIENHIRSDAVRACPGIRGLDGCRAAEQFGACRDVQRMKALIVFSGCVLGHGYEVDRAMWSARPVDHGSGRDADVRRH